MDGKADVKALMAKFNAGNSPTEDVSGNSRPFKVPGQPIHSGLQARKAALEKFASQGNAASPSGPSTFHKPVHSKPPLGVKPVVDDKTEKDPKPPYLKPVAQRFGVQLQATNRENDAKAGCPKTPSKSSDLAKEEPRPLYPKPPGKFLNSVPQEKEKKPLGPKPNLNSASQESEPTVFSKVAGVKEKFTAATQENEPKTPFSKPPLAQKPSVNHEVSHNEDTFNRNAFLHKGLSGPRPKINSLIAAKETDEDSNNAAEAAGSHFSNMALKPTGNWSGSSQVIPKNVEEKPEEKGVGAAKNIFLNRISQEQSGSSPSKFLKTNTAFAAGRLSGGSQEKEDGDKNLATPKRKALPPLFTLGQPPQKPSRPPNVDLERFRKNSTRDSPRKEGFKQLVPSSAALSSPVPPPHSATQLPPLPPASHPSLQAPAAPSLPPRNSKLSSETTSPDNEENYDDVEFDSQSKTGHGNIEEGQESAEEMYEDINNVRSTSAEKEKKRDKEEKKRMEQEKKEQKEKEKKEQEIRKKFKLMGPIQVLHQARACTDYKGGKNELTVKQGDQIEIIRLTDNPEGKWLGRIKGSYGYVKTTVVEIDYDSLKRKQQPAIRAAVKHADSDQEVYDDVGEQDSISSQSGGQTGTEMMFLPPPSDQEIYDGIDDEDVSICVTSPTKQFGKDCGDSDVYDDVDASDFPPPSAGLNSSKPVSLGKGKPDEKDARKLKKMEREEKEFRKKFKFEGEIRVLYSSTTIQDLPQRRWGSKDLQVKPGESLEIIENTDDTKVLCRNEEGKYGYVLRSNLVENDGEIYDDIGDGCIYDND
ncbi:FYN-binding protein 1-like isoform X3 [Dromaius novaehollandiae]|uniref:FYN-binding protein 1-like isoform X3 n=1 Tax=Dromaius novaehollandiae TaxID=8790 RepID=UPI00311FFE0F